MCVCVWGGCEVAACEAGRCCDDDREVVSVCVCVCVSVCVCVCGEVVSVCVFENLMIKMTAQFPHSGINKILPKPLIPLLALHGSKVNWNSERVCVCSYILVFAWLIKPP